MPSRRYRIPSTSCYRGDLETAPSIAAAPQLAVCLIACCREPWLSAGSRCREGRYSLQPPPNPAEGFQNHLDRATHFLGDKLGTVSHALELDDSFLDLVSRYGVHSNVFFQHGTGLAPEWEFSVLDPGDRESSFLQFRYCACIPERKIFFDPVPHAAAIHLISVNGIGILLQETLIPIIQGFPEDEPGFAYCLLNEESIQQSPITAGESYRHHLRLL